MKRLLTHLTRPEKIKALVAVSLIALLIGAPIVFLLTGGWVGALTRMMPGLAGLGSLNGGNASFVSCSGAGGAGADVAEPTTLDEPIDRAVTFEADAVRDLDIVWLTGSVEIRQGTSEEVVVRETVDAGTYDADPTRVTIDMERDGVLVIDDHLPENLSASRWPEMRLTIELPAETLKRLGAVSLKSASAASTVAGATCESLRVNTVSSSVAVTGVSARDVSIEGVSGEVVLAGTVTGDLGVDTVSGETRVTLDGTLPSHASLASISGAVTLNLPADAAFTLTPSSVSGAVTVVHGYDRTDVDGAYRAGDGTAQIEIGTVSGSIRVA